MLKCCACVVDVKRMYKSPKAQPMVRFRGGLKKADWSGTQQMQGHLYILKCRIYCD